MPVLPGGDGRAHRPGQSDRVGWIGLVMAVATFWRRRCSAICPTASGGGACCCRSAGSRSTALAIVETLCCSRARAVGVFGGYAAARQRSPTSLRRNSARAICFVGAAFGVGFVAGRRSEPWRDRPARSLRRRRDRRCQHALWPVHLSRHTPAPPRVQLAARHPLAPTMRSAEMGGVASVLTVAILALVYPMTWSFYHRHSAGRGDDRRRLAAVGVMIALGQTFVVGPMVALWRARRGDDRHPDRRNIWVMPLSPRPGRVPAVAADRVAGANTAYSTR